MSSQLEVRPVEPAERTDADIAWAAANVLAWNALVPHERISVSVTRGWIVLEGAVERRFQKSAAEDAVADLKGVVGVTNLIEVQPAVPALELKERNRSRAASVARTWMPTGLLSKWKAIARAYGAALVRWPSARQRNGRCGRLPGLRELSNHLTVESHAYESCVRLGLLSAVLRGWGRCGGPAQSATARDLVDSGALSDLRWPNFTRLQPDVATFYESNGYQLAWIREGEATPQAQALIHTLEKRVTQRARSGGL